MNSVLPILYSFRRCPYAMRARLAIAASEQKVALREVVLRNKPQAMLDASPKGTVPVLVVPNGQVIDESLDVMLWALQQNDPENWLMPMDSLDRNASTLIQENDGPFKANLDRYKYPNRYDDVDPLYHRSEGVKFLKKLDDRLGGQPYICGDEFTIVDAAIAPFVRQFANVDRGWFDSIELPGLQRWLEEFLQSSRFQSIMTKYPTWEEGAIEPEFPD